MGTPSELISDIYEKLNSTGMSNIGFKPEWAMNSVYMDASNTTSDRNKVCFSNSSPFVRLAVVTLLIENGDITEGGDGGD